jgi:LysR family transcriptional regulator, glycine cleavage system transcriptional activator
MPTRLPPLHALSAFAVAARLGSLSRAAEELSVTQSAISHRIQALEKWAGQKLLVRLARGVELTAHGARILDSVTTALNVLETSARHLPKRGHRSLLRISVLPSFASHWLIPRLDGFRKTHPDVELDIRASWRLARLDRDEVDMALRSGPKEWPNAISVKLMDEWYYPVCSPAYRGSVGGLKQPKDLLRLPLLRHSRESWVGWLTKANLLGTPAVGPLFSDAGLLLQAAAAHQGVALARHTIAEGFINRGELVRLFDLAVRADCAYWAVTSTKRQEDKGRDAFIAWIQGEAVVCRPPETV